LLAFIAVSVAPAFLQNVFSAATALLLSGSKIPAPKPIAPQPEATTAAAAVPSSASATGASSAASSAPAVQPVAVVGPGTKESFLLQYRLGEFEGVLDVLVSSLVC